MVLGTAKQTHRKIISWPTTRSGDVSKKNFDGIHDRFQQDSVHRDSQLKIGPRRGASRWINWHRKTTPAAHPSFEEYERRKTGTSH